MVDVRMPDGTIIRNVPPGTTKAQLQAKLSKKKATNPINYGAGDLATSKLSLGISDRVMAGADALIRSGIDAAKGDFHAPRYTESQNEVDRQKAAYKAAHPGVDWATLPLNLMAGGSKLPGLLAEKIGGGAMRQAAGVGAAFGAGAGVGNARGDLADQAGQIGASTIFGAITGPIAAKVVPWAIGKGSEAKTAVARMLSERAGKSRELVEGAVDEGLQNVPDPQPAVRKIIQKALAAQGMTPKQAGRMLDDARSRGVPLGLMDTGDEMRGLASALSRKPGASRTIMRDSVVGRQEGQLDRVQGAIQRDLGETVGVATEAQRLEQLAKAAAEPLYRRAYASGPVNDPVIAQLVRHPEMQSALAAGRQIHADDAFMAQARGEPVPPPMSDNGVDVLSLDYAKRALDRKIDSAYSGDSQAKMQLPFLRELRSTLLTRLDDSVPDYGAARRAYGGPLQLKEALEAGRGAVNKGADDIAAEIAGMSPTQLEQYKLGLRSGLSNLLEGKADDANKVRAIVGTPKKRAILSQLFGDDANFERFMATLADEGAAAATHGRVAMGSPTASNLADDATIDGPGGIMANMAARALTGRGMVGNALDTVRDAMRYGAGKSGEVVRSQLASGLSETDPVMLAARLRAMEAFNKKARFDRYKALKRSREPAAAGGIMGGYLLGGNDR